MGIDLDELTAKLEAEVEKKDEVAPKKKDSKVKSTLLAGLLMEKVNESKKKKLNGEANA